jgi:hypothetical protein
MVHTPQARTVDTTGDPAPQHMSSVELQLLAALEEDKENLNAYWMEELGRLRKKLHGSRGQGRSGTGS